MVPQVDLYVPVSLVGIIFFGIAFIVIRGIVHLLP